MYSLMKHNGIVIAVIYHPPCLPVKEHDDLNKNLINTTDLIRNKYNNFNENL